MNSASGEKKTIGKKQLTWNFHVDKFGYNDELETFVAELAAREQLYEIVVTRPAEKIWTCDRTTVRPTVQSATFSMRGQLYYGHYLGWKGEGEGNAQARLRA